MSKHLAKVAPRVHKFKSIFPKANLLGQKVVHPTAVYEDKKGDFHILLMNGL